MYPSQPNLTKNQDPFCYLAMPDNELFFIAVSTASCRIKYLS